MQTYGARSLPSKIVNAFLQTKKRPFRAVMPTGEEKDSGFVAMSLFPCTNTLMRLRSSIIKKEIRFVNFISVKNNIFGTMISIGFGVGDTLNVWHPLPRPCAWFVLFYKAIFVSFTSSVLSSSSHEVLVPARLKENVELK
ncbi:hypothetical protein YC2023_112815 [Brassica napus]